MDIDRPNLILIQSNGFVCEYRVDNYEVYVRDLKLRRQICLYDSKTDERFGGPNLGGSGLGDDFCRGF